MSKGMSLEEFRNNLEGDAQKKVKELEEKIAVQNNTINALAVERRHYNRTLEKKDKQMHNLCNRCRSLTGMTLCGFCGLRIECSVLMHKYGITMPTVEEVEDKMLETCREYCKTDEVLLSDVAKTVSTDKGKSLSDKFKVTFEDAKNKYLRSKQ